MKKSLVIVLLSFNTIYSYAQKVYTNNLEKDSNYLYTDTIDNKVYLGEIAPTGLISIPNGNIISSTFSIYFTELYSPLTDTSKYNLFKKIYPHINASSGCIFKLNNKLKKDWEIILKEKSVAYIANYDSTSFIATGNRTDMKNIWVARINSINGNIIWYHEYSAKRKSTVESLAVADNKDIIVLNSSSRLILFKIDKQYGRKRWIVLKDRDGVNNKLWLLNITKDGDLNWEQKVPTKAGNDLFDEKLGVSDNINILYTTKENVHRLKNHESEFTDINVDFNLAGKKINSGKINIESYLANIGGYLYTHSHSDRIYKYQYNDTLNQICSYAIKLPERFTNIESMQLINGYYYLYGSTKIKEIMICKFDIQFHLLASWIYKTKEMVTDLQLALSPRDKMIVIGKCFIGNDDYKKTLEYIDLLEFNSN